MSTAASPTTASKIALPVGSLSPCSAASCDWLAAQIKASNKYDAFIREYCVVDEVDAGSGCTITDRNPGQNYTAHISGAIEVDVTEGCEHELGDVFDCWWNPDDGELEMKQPREGNVSGSIFVAIIPAIPGLIGLYYIFEILVIEPRHMAEKTGHRPMKGTTSTDPFEAYDPGAGLKPPQATEGFQ